jgi:hypothetical protein
MPRKLPFLAFRGGKPYHKLPRKQKKQVRKNMWVRVVDFHPGVKCRLWFSRRYGWTVLLV